MRSMAGGEFQQPAEVETTTCGVSLPEKSFPSGVKDKNIIRSRIVPPLVSSVHEQLVRERE